MLKRELGLSAVIAVVIGDMLGSGVFFAPGQLAAVAHANYQIYLFWSVAGIVTLCGALSLAEMTALLPKAGATYHIIREGFGPFGGFLKIWVEMFVGGPGSVAGVAILFGEFLSHFLQFPPSLLGAGAVIVFTIINLLGVRWGGRTQIAITLIKVIALFILVIGAIALAKPVSAAFANAPGIDVSLGSLFPLIGLGIGAVLFTYDGWIDVTHIAGEVRKPERNLPRSLLLGVGGIIGLYLLVNYAFLRVVPLEAMRNAPDRVAVTVAIAAFGPVGANFLQALIAVSMLGALGGLIMTIPRLFYSAALEYQARARLFKAMSQVSGTDVPYVSILFVGATSIFVLCFFTSFSRIVNFFVVPLQLVNIAMVASIFKLRRRTEPRADGYRTPLFPLTPMVYIIVMSGFILSAIIYNPADALIGLAFMAAGVPLYVWIR